MTCVVKNDNHDIISLLEKRVSNEISPYNELKKISVRELVKLYREKKLVFDNRFVGYYKCANIIHIDWSIVYPFDNYPLIISIGDYGKDYPYKIDIIREINKYNKGYGAVTLFNIFRFMGLIEDFKPFITSCKGNTIFPNLVWDKSFFPDNEKSIELSGFLKEKILNYEFFVFMCDVETRPGD